MILEYFEAAGPLSRENEIIRQCKLTIRQWNE